MDTEIAVAAMNDIAVPFAGRVTESEFSRVQSALMPAWYRWYFLALAWLLLFFSMRPGLAKVMAEPALALPGLIWGVGVLVVCACITRFLHWRGWKQYMQVHGSVSGQIGPQGITWKTESIIDVLEWEKALGFRARKDLFLVLYTPRCAFFFPRSFFATEQDWSRLQLVLQQYSKTV